MSASLELGTRLGTRLKERRQELGKRLAEVAAAADVSGGYLSSIENGASVPSLPVLARLSHALEQTDVFVFLYRGRLAVEVDDARFELEAGDALQCDMPRRVTWEALGRERAVSLWTAAARPGRAG